MYIVVRINVCIITKYRGLTVVFDYDCTIIYFDLFFVYCEL